MTVYFEQSQFSRVRRARVILNEIKLFVGMLHTYTHTHMVWQTRADRHDFEYTGRSCQYCSQARAVEAEKIKKNNQWKFASLSDDMSISVGPSGLSITLLIQGIQFLVYNDRADSQPMKKLIICRLKGKSEVGRPDQFANPLESKQNQSRAQSFPIRFFFNWSHFSLIHISR